MEKRLTSPIRAHDSSIRDISESLGKLPPQALDLEEAILGALLLEKNSLIEIAGVLKVEHFYAEQHQIIYQAIIQLFSEGSPVDMRSVVAELRKMGKLELIGGAYYIAELTSKVSSAANIEFHTRIVIELSIKRSLITIASGVHHDAYEDTVDVFDLYAKLNLQLQDVLDKAVSNRAEKSAKEVSLALVRDVQGRQSGKHMGLDSGFTEIDRILNGLPKTDLIIIAARPGMGKSVLAVQMGKQVAEQNIPVGIFALEMSGQQVIERLSVAESEIMSDKIKKGQMEGYEFERWMDAVGKISVLPIYIDDTPSLTIVELRARAIRMKMKYGIQLLIVDYLQLLRGIDSGRGGNRDQEIGIITRTLKAIAKELDLPVIALSQLSRDVEKRGGNKRPVLSDLRESGSIEQDADTVLFIYRPEYYHITVDEDGLPTQGLAEIIVAKHRNGSLDTAKLKFTGKFTKFSQWISEPWQRPVNQSDYAQKHSKDVLPSERTTEQFGQSDTPF